MVTRVQGPPANLREGGSQRQSEAGDRGERWERRRHGLTDTFTLAVSREFPVAADTFSTGVAGAGDVTVPSIAPRERRYDHALRRE